MDPFTYGRTPAAMYLARKVNEINDAVLTRSCGKKITATNNTVSELIRAYETGACSAKTVANCLRLMRADISATECHYLVDQLCRNVQIGYIKRGLRLCHVARKGERVMENPDANSSRAEVVINEAAPELGRTEMAETFYYFIDYTNGAEYLAGSSQTYAGNPWFSMTRTTSNGVMREDVQDTTPELLMERSNRRCLRLGKAHMVGNE